MANGQGGNQGGSGGGNIPPVPNPMPNPADMQAVVDKLEAILRLTNDITVQSQRNVNSAEAELQALEKRKILLESQQQTAERDLELLRLQRQERETRLELLKNELNLVNDNLVKEREKLEKLQIGTQAYTDQKKIVDDLTETMEFGVSFIREGQIELQRFNEANKLRNELAEQAVAIERRFGNLVENSFNQTIKQIGATTGLGEILTAFMSGPAAGFMAIVERTVAESIKLIDVVAKGNQQFAATTGQIAQRSLGFGYGMSQFGVGFQQMNEAMMGLFTSMSGFTDQSQEVQEQLAGAAAKMKNLGVDIATTGKNFDILTKSLKMSADSAIDAQDKIAKHAIAAGIAPKQMLQEFASNMPRLAAYGQQAVDIFIKLEKQAKSLGMSVQELNSIIGEQYDTFDGAAQGAGKLNAILGGNYLNSIQMMNANESERIMIIKRAVDASGLQIDSMHKFQQIAIANAMGIKDLSKLKNLLGKSTSELTMDMEKEAASQAELEKVQAAAVDMQQKLNIVFQAFLVIIKPIVTTIQVIAMVITKLNDVLGGFLVPIIIFTAAIWKFGAAWQFLKTTTTSGKLMIALTALAFVFGLMHDAVTKPKSPPLYLAIPLLALGIKFLGEVVETEIPTLLAIGASLLMIGVAVKLAASGLAELVKSFEKLNNAQLDAVSNAIAYFTLMFVGFTVALAALAYSGVGEIAVGLLLAFGGAVLMIGLGVGIAAYGISIMVDSIAKLAGSITAEAAKNIINIAGAIGILASTLTTVGIFGSIGMTMGVLSVSVALSAIISSINNINETKTVAFTNLLKTFSESLKLTGIEAISIQIATAINNISAAIDKVPESKAVNFTSTMDSINRTFSSVAQVDANKMESAKQFVDTATKYYAVQKDSKGADNDALVAAITKALSSANTGKNTTNIATQQPIIVSVEIEGKEVARALARLPLVDGSMRG